MASVVAIVFCLFSKVVVKMNRAVEARAVCGAKWVREGRYFLPFFLFPSLPPSFILLSFSFYPPLGWCRFRCGVGQATTQSISGFQNGITMVYTGT